ncbi:hypothetical protein [Nocardioides campestrisoli]|uniref:hypothetical protein n=1 Tax=Nocardioides campestrisoli TaxID=2736757 RepID=UPI00163D6831|nr:hypothetical protein [Nocardioides campestrisoli]
MFTTTSPAGLRVPNGRAKTVRSMLLGLVAGLAVTTVPATAAAAPGDREWQSVPLGQYAGVFTVDEASGDVVMTAESFDADGLLTRVDGATGAVEWAQPLPENTYVQRIVADGARDRLVTVGVELDYPQSRYFAESQDAAGRVVWRHDLSEWAIDDAFEDLTVDEGTGQACALISGKGDGPKRWSRTDSVTCLDVDGRVTFTREHASSRGSEGRRSLAVDPHSHRILHSTYGRGKRPHHVLVAYSAQGEILWQRHGGKGAEAHDLLVDPRRRLAHVVTTHPRSNQVSLLTHDLTGRLRSTTRWASPTDFRLEPETAAVLPRTGRVVVASLAGNRLVVRTVTHTGRKVAAMQARKARRNPHVAVDVRSGGVVMTANYRSRLDTTAFTRHGKVRWSRTTKERGGLVPHAGFVQDGRRYVMAADGRRTTRLVAFQN